MKRHCKNFVQWLAVFLLTLRYVKTLSDENERTMNTLRPSIEALCPGVEICGTNTALPENAEIEMNSVSCCKACSCADNCRNGTCCFNTDTPTGNKHASLRTCQYPIANINDELNFWPKYYMIDTPPAGGCISSVDTCTSTPLYPWGDILPVISKKNHLIYKTPSCAACHGLSNDDYEEWGGRLLCTTNVDDEFMKIIDFDDDLFLPNRQLFPHCSIVFSNKGNDLHEGNERCYDILESSCAENTYSIPVVIGMNSTMVKAACMDGPVVPVMVSKPYMYRNVNRQSPNTAYRNIYCQICADEYTPSGTQSCLEDDKLHEDYITNVKQLAPVPSWVFPLSGLFVPKILGQIVTRNGRVNQSVPVACDDNLGDTEGATLCRRILCPIDHMRDVNGNCIPLIQTWDHLQYSFALRLTLENAFGHPLGYAEDIFKPLLNDLTQYLPILPVDVITYYHVLPCDQNMISDFILVLKLTISRSSVIVEQLTKSLDDAIHRTFVFSLSPSIKIPYTVELDLTPDIALAGNFDVPLVRPERFISNPFNVSELCHQYTVYPGDGFDKNRPIHITNVITYLSKIHLCENIFIRQFEYSFLTYDRNRYLVFNDRTFSEIEFILVTKENNELGARICLRDSGFKKKSSGVESNKSEMTMQLSTHMFIVSVFFSLILLTSLK